MRTKYGISRTPLIKDLTSLHFCRSFPVDVKCRGIRPAVQLHQSLHKCDTKAALHPAERRQDALFYLGVSKVRR